MLLSKLISDFKNELELFNFKDTNVNGIQSNSKQIKLDDVFFAVDGLNVKGINFVDEAIKNGAKVVICSKIEEYTNKNVIIIKTNDVIGLLGKFLNIFYAKKPKHIIGITGTSGKTSIAEFTRQTIQELGYDSASIGSLGINFENSHLKKNAMTMPELVDLHEKLNYLKTEKNIDFVAIEMTSQGMHQQRNEGINVEIGVFNNITPEHLDYHKTMEEYFKQKMQLFKTILKDGSPVVLNADVPEFNKVKDICLAKKHKILSYGFNGDLKILEIKSNSNGQTVKFKYLNEEYILNSHLIGKFQVMNLLATLCILIQLNINSNIEKLIGILEKIKEVEGRMQLVAKKVNGALIYIDYAHKPDALKQVLETMREHISHDKKARVIVLFGCDGERDKTKRSVMGKIANDLADIVFITDDNPRSEDATTIRNQIMEWCPNAFNIGDRKLAIEKAIDLLEPKDTLILAGKGHEKYMIIGKDVLPFDELQIVKDYLKND
ncbi:MAG: UDP-N-acetylmuramoyl-L-alanyl-D-glutamate--2,6-diaminopimelate ligase [Rickettsiales bacterium]|nr:UDP-N-acetylmuramoyl-L-alanyl-D-glutamate--2,6-diaminopimelate ligase [Rickettsiales bacterium]